MKISSPISMEMISYFIGVGFRESEHFTKNGILYVELPKKEVVKVKEIQVKIA